MNTLEFVQPDAVITVVIGTDHENCRIDREVKFNEVIKIFNNVVFDFADNVFVKLIPVFNNCGKNYIKTTSGFIDEDSIILTEILPAIMTGIYEQKFYAEQKNILDM